MQERLCRQEVQNKGGDLLELSSFVGSTEDFGTRLFEEGSTK